MDNNPCPGLTYDSCDDESSACPDRTEEVPQYGDFACQFNPAQTGTDCKAQYSTTEGVKKSHCKLVYKCERQVDQCV